MRNFSSSGPTITKYTRNFNLQMHLLSYNKPLTCSKDMLTCSQADNPIVYLNGAVNAKPFNTAYLHINITTC